MRAFAILPLATAILVLILGAAVAIRERASRISRRFLLLAAALTVWLLCFSRMYSTVDPREALFWAKAAFLGIGFVPAAVYQFIAGLEHRERRSQPIARFVWIGSALFTLLILTTDQIVDGVDRYPWGFYPRYAWASGPYLLFFFFCLGAAMWHAIETRRNAVSVVERRRMQSVILSLAVGYIACFDYLPSFGVDVLPLGFLAITGFVLMMGYTVWRYELGEITDELAAPAVIRSMRGSVVIADLKGQIRVVSDGARRLIGLSDDDPVRGRSLEDLSPALAGRSVDTTSISPFIFENEEYVWKSKSGEAIDVAVSAALLSDRRGRPAGVVYTAEDISRRKREEALRASEARYRALVESMNEGVMLVGLDDLIEFVNQRLADMLGYNAAELIGKPASTFIATSTGTSARLRTIRGNDLWVDISEAPLRDGRGNRTGSIRVLTDVTDRRRVELALRESESRYRLLAEYATDMISRHTPDGRFLYASPAAMPLLGYAPEELIGMAALDLMHPEDRPTVENLRSALTGTSEPTAARFRMRRKDGSYVWVETTWRPVTLRSAEQQSEIVAVSRDISDRKKNAAEPISAE